MSDYIPREQLESVLRYVAYELSDGGDVGYGAAEACHRIRQELGLPTAAA